MARRGMRDVILADDGDPEDDERARGDPHGAGPAADRAAPFDAHEQPDADGRPDAGRRAWGRRRRRWALAAAVALAVALVAVMLVDGVTDRRRAARLADTPGVLEPMSPALRVLWSEPGGWNHPAVHGPDVMVSLFEGPGPEFRLVTNDIVTGEQRWDVALPDLQVYDDLSCRAHGAEARGTSTHIFCQQRQPVPPGSFLPSDESRARRSLLVFDARSGTKVGDRTLEAGSGTVEPFGADVLVTTVLEDGRVRLTREDLLTGTARWSATSEQYPGAAGATPPLVRTEGEVIVLEGPLGMVVSPEGQVLGEWSPPRDALLDGPEALPVDVTVLAGGRFVVGGSDRRPDVPYGTVLASDGDEQFVVDGAPLLLAVDDGSAEDLLLTVAKQGDRIVAVDSRTGQRRWAAEVTLAGRREGMLLDGRLIVPSGDDLIAVDTRTGRPLWTANHSQGDHALLTDGRVVLVPTVPADGESTLTAVSVADGRVRWTARGPADVVTFYAIGGRLIALQREQMMRLGTTPAGS